MKNAKISRRSFLLGLAACSAAGILTACKGDDTPASSASTSPEAPASSVSELEPLGLFTVEDFPKLDGSTACIPLMAQMMADTTGIDLEVAQSGISVSTTAYAWENFGLYPDEEYTARMLVVYEAPDYVKEELKEANAQLEQKPIGRDALVFIVNENNPVKSLTRQAAGTGLREPFSLCEIEAVRRPSGAPNYRFSGKRAEWVAARRLTAKLSLSHDGGMALAFCTLEQLPPET